MCVILFGVGGDDDDDAAGILVQPRKSAVMRELCLLILSYKNIYMYFVFLFFFSPIFFFFSYPKRWRCLHPNRHYVDFTFPPVRYTQVDMYL